MNLFQTNESMATQMLITMSTTGFLLSANVVISRHRTTSTIKESNVGSTNAVKTMMVRISGLAMVLGPAVEMNAGRCDVGTWPNGRSNIH